MLNRLRWCATGALFFVIGCVNDQAGHSNVSSDPPATEEAYWQAMLEHYAVNIVLPAYTDAEIALRQLAGDTGAVNQYCQAIGGEREAEAKVAAQQSWRSTMSLWQQIEVMQFGPLFENGGALRNQIYSYNSSTPMSACSVDQSVILSQQSGFDIQQRSNGSKGLAALEYLLFNNDLSHQCAPQVTLTQSWDQLSELERKQQRCDYAVQVAADTSLTAARLLEAWEPTGGNYLFEFTHPSYIEDRLNAISDALFYIELLTKDRKLGVAAGIHTDCSQIVCPQVVESPYSDHALVNIKHNLLAFRSLLNGSEGIGFDDVIIQQGFPETVTAFNADIDAAIDIIDGNSTPMLDQLASIEASGDRSACDNAAANPQVASELSVCRLHGMVKRITDRLRTDFVAIVNLDLPDRAQSDND